jgi:hypothetical protein
MKVKEPKWRVGQQADWELRQYRERLENALPTLPVGSDPYADHADRRKQVASEQESRQRRDETP